MPTTSDTIPQVLFLCDVAGNPVTFANAAAFIAAGWNLTWQDNTGTALGSQPTWTLSAGDSNGRHVVGFQPPDGSWTVKLTVPAGYRSDPAEFAGEATVYDADSLYGLLVASDGVPVTESTTTGDLDIFDANSIIIDFSILEAALTELGIANLASADSMSAQIKLTSKNSADASDATLTTSIISDVSGARTVRGELDTFPAALEVPTGAKTLDTRADLRITKGAKTITVAIRNVTFRWKANT